MVFGHLGSKDYTTRRGKTVHMGGYDSAIGRLGILFGKRVTEGEHPYDYYLKFSVLMNLVAAAASIWQRWMGKPWITAKIIRIPGKKQDSEAAGISVKTPICMRMRKEASEVTGIRNGSGNIGVNWQF